MCGVAGSCVFCRFGLVWVCVGLGFVLGVFGCLGGVDAWGWGLSVDFLGLDVLCGFGVGLGLLFGCL